MPEKYFMPTCTGNRTRSVFLECGMGKSLERRGITEYGVISSGTLANKLQNSQVPTKIQVEFLQRAIKGGYFDGRQSEIEGIIERNVEGGISEAYHEAMSEYVKRETEYKQPVFAAHGVTFKEKGEQTIVRDDIVAIFPVNLANKRRVERIYAEVENPPLIEVFSGYALGISDMKVNYPVWEGKAAFTQFMEWLWSLIDPVLDRFFREHDPQYA